MEKIQLTKTFLLLASAAFLAAPTSAGLSLDTAEEHTLTFVTKTAEQTTVRIEFPEKQQLVMTISNEHVLTGLQIHVQEDEMPSQAVADVSKLILDTGLGYGQDTQLVVGQDVVLDIPLSSLLQMASPLGQIILKLTDSELKIVPDVNMTHVIAENLTKLRSAAHLDIKAQKQKTPVAA